jgi:hypothetical protein
MITFGLALVVTGLHWFRHARATETTRRASVQTGATTAVTEAPRVAERPVTPTPAARRVAAQSLIPSAKLATRMRTGAQSTDRVPHQTKTIDCPPAIVASGAQDVSIKDNIAPPCYTFADLRGARGVVIKDNIVRVLANPSWNRRAQPSWTEVDTPTAPELPQLPSGVPSGPLVGKMPTKGNACCRHDFGF